MISILNQQYQRPIHRIALQLQRRNTNQPLLAKTQQASHLCMDDINVDGKGTKHCVNVNHMVVEDDKTNKMRQRCQGWIWIHPHDGNSGNYWYPSCVHSPPCLRYQPKSTVPTHFDSLKYTLTLHLPKMAH
jgi:Zinc-binding loop region of homing endonuclease